MSVIPSFVQQNIIYSDKTEKASDIEERGRKSTQLTSLSRALYTFQLAAKNR